MNVEFLRTRHKIVPDLKTVSLTPRNPTLPPIKNIADVARRATRRGEIQQSTAGLTTETSTFIIPVIELNRAAGNTTTVPKDGWWITDEDGTWTIQSLSRELAGSVYRCACTKNRGTGM